MPLLDTSFLQGINPQNPIAAGNAQTDEMYKQQMAPLQINAAQLANQSSQLEMANKRRGMALSMMNGLTGLEPDKAAALYPTLKGMAERYDPTLQLPEDYNPLISKAMATSQIPVTSMPEYQMNMAKINYYNSMLPGGQPNQQNPAVQSGTQGGQDGTQMSGGDVTGGSTPANPSVPTPTLSPLLTNPAAAVFDAPGVTAAAAALKAQQDTPEGKQRVAAAEAQGKNAAEAAKGAIESDEGYKQVEKTIDSIETLIKTGDLPQAKYGAGAEHWAALSQNFPQYDNQKTANAYNTFKTVNEAQTINAIRDLASTGQIRMTRTLENIINQGYLVDPNASDAAKMAQAEAIKTELKNSAIAAHNVNAKMNGGQEQPYQSPVTPVQQAQAKLKPPAIPPGTPVISSPGDPAFKSLPPGAKFVTSDGRIMVKH